MNARTHLSRRSVHFLARSLLLETKGCNFTCNEVDSEGINCDEESEDDGDLANDALWKKAKWCFSLAKALTDGVEGLQDDYEADFSKPSVSQLQALAKAQQQTKSGGESLMRTSRPGHAERRIREAEI